MHLFYQSLGVRVVLLITVVSVLVFSGLFAANATWQARSTMQLAASSSGRTADLILLAVEEPMRLGKNQETAHVFEKVAGRDKASRIYLTNFRGNVTYATDPAVVRKDLAQALPAPDIQSLAAASLAGQEGSGRTTLDGREFLAMTKPIRNEAECHHCHGASKPVLGAIVVLQDITPVLTQTVHDQFMGGAISLAGMVLLLALVTWFMRRAVLGRVKTIADNASLVRQGRHDVDFAMKGQDELAGLASDLAAMVSTIQDQLAYNRSVLAGINIPLFVTNQNLEFCFVNDHLARILGSKESALLCRHADISLSEGGAPVSVSRDVFASGQAASGKLHFENAQGVVFPLHYEVSPLKGADGKTLGVIGVFMDLTEEEDAKLAMEEQRMQLMDVAQQVMDVSAKLSASALELSGQMEGLTKSVEQTAAETSGLTTAMDQMNETVLDVAKVAGDTAGASEKANQVARDGGVEVRRTAEETRQVAQRAEELARSLGDLNDRALNIGNVMNVVGDIADQTNLLALNAAIEAARAGDAGRGFAVVADEVRKLAEKTMHATREVAEAVREIQDGTRRAAEGMDGTRQAMEHAAGTAGSTGEVFLTIVEHSNRIGDMIRAIAASADEQSSTSEAINGNVGHINALSQDIFSRIRDAHQRIAEVRDMSAHLADLASRFSGRNSHDAALPT
ncbi:Methyl-accepting chemotaxis protein McpQ [Fundidesulfovibrio magnetotacticus]|uniref:Methyl-accepting chemotaxis protein McpQ n=1 Tax=Fundidesulfovibrio magnetotacticus TaxID=2730080 RepID=A0A6V8LL23_9BACT|nr:methyl-accepting chemotaxis protein [Fundidesulfovibrio magnetotacticus]GFK92394.1 Methyl-accepting chemotaxis protein McpQ [Fundidesulfovibrio magnetotacticus]